MQKLLETILAWLFRSYCPHGNPWCREDYPCSTCWREGVRCVQFSGQKRLKKPRRTQERNGDMLRIPRPDLPELARPIELKGRKRA